MVIKEFKLEEIPWTVTFVYNASTSEIPQVIGYVENNDGLAWQVEATKKMYENPNQAFIQTSKSKRSSLILFSNQTSRDEFVDSLVHEILHLSRHIEMCGNNESTTTILGNLARDIFKLIYP